MTDNSKRVLAFLKDNAGEAFTVKEIAAALGLEKPAAVVGSVTSFRNKGYVERTETEEEVTTVTKDGTENTKIDKVLRFTITQEGLDWDPSAPVAE